MRVLRLGLSCGERKPVRVEYGSLGTAEEGKQYVLKEGVLTFAPARP